MENCSESGEDPHKIVGRLKATLDVELRKDFELFRDYAKHEDSLVIARTNWFITLNSFLFTSLALGARYDDDGYLRNEFLVFAILLSFIGIVISRSTRMSVTAAYESISMLRKIWRNTFETNDRRKHKVTDLIYPFLSGGGPADRLSYRNRVGVISRRGDTLSSDLPLVVGFAWLFIGVFSLTTWLLTTLIY